MATPNYRATSQPDPGWEDMYCVHHPNLRWRRKSREHMAHAISRNIQIRFLGDTEQPQKLVCDFRQSPTMRLDGTTADSSPEYEDYLREKFVFECQCKYADLRYVVNDDHDIEV